MVLIDASGLGRCIGFFASMFLFATLLYFVTRKLGFQSFEYTIFMTGFVIFYFIIKFSRKVIKNGADKIS